MFCTQCGNLVTGGNGFCHVCGTPTVPANAPINDASHPAHWQDVFTEPKTDAKAIASLVFGCLSFLFPAAVLAIILGHISLSEIARNSGRTKGKGLAISGLVLGYAGATLVPILFVVMIVSLIPGSRQARHRTATQVQTIANLPPAVASIRALNTSEIGFEMAHPEIGYSCKLDDLVGADSMYGWRDAELAGGRKNGYVFVVQNCSPGSKGPNSKYQITADPVDKNSSLRAFCSDESATLRYDAGGSGKKCLFSGVLLQ